MSLSAVLVSSSLFCDRCLEIDPLYSLGIKTTACMIPGLSRDGLSYGHGKGCAQGHGVSGMWMTDSEIVHMKKGSFLFLARFCSQPDFFMLPHCTLSRKSLGACLPQRFSPSFISKECVIHTMCHERNTELKHVRFRLKWKAMEQLG